MSRVTATVVVRGENGEPHVLQAGDEIPKWAEVQVGDHVRSDDKPKAEAKKPVAAVRQSK